ncbi:Exc2 family lipoprotein [Enterobacter huaxiensis]|uniref:Exc2 family lipoprotein n=1 Tax=Enterobacter huaxiensis TaxID=2494702 RepID=UPI0039679CFC
MNGKAIAVILGIAVLSGCAGTKTSPERHAYYFVSHKTSFTGGNFTSSVPENYRLNVPQFRELHARGKADRAEGRTLAEANEYAQSIRDQLKENAKSQQSFSGNANDKWSSDMDMKDAVLFGNELAATYLDGYNGVQ